MTIKESSDDVLIRRTETLPAILQRACESSSHYNVVLKSGVRITFRHASIGGHGVEAPI
jgi:hypothetical protein